MLGLEPSAGRHRQHELLLVWSAAVSGRVARPLLRADRRVLAPHATREWTLGPAGRRSGQCTARVISARRKASLRLRKPLSGGPTPFACHVGGRGLSRPFTNVKWHDAASLTLGRRVPSTPPTSSVRKRPLHRPRQTFGGDDLYPSLVSKARSSRTIVLSVSQYSSSLPRVR